MKVTISRLAKNDLEDIWLFTKNRWALRKADTYLRFLFKEIERIQLNPYLGNDYGFIRQGYRKLTYKSHSIYYKISTSNNCIEIIRVLHQSRDINKIL